MVADVSMIGQIDRLLQAQRPADTLAREGICPSACAKN
jgi:hypothetical protein